MIRLIKIPVLFLALSAVPAALLGADTSSALQDYQAGRYEQAFGKFQAASHKGDITALYYAGMMYAKGQGVGKDVGKGLYCLRTAASKGSREAALMLADLYQSGEAGQRNEAEAQRWRTLAQQQPSKPDTITQAPSTSSPETSPVLNVDKATLPKTKLSRLDRIKRISQSPRLALRAVLILGIPFLVLVMLLRSGSRDPLPPLAGSPGRGFRTEDAISIGWRLVRRNIGFSIALTLLYAFLYSALSQLLGLLPITSVFISGILLLVGTIFLDVFRVRIALDTLDHGIANGSGVAIAISRGFSFILCSLLYSLAIGFGTLLLIFPGIYFYCKYYFAPWIVVDQGIGAFSAMERSAQLTDGIKFRIFIFQMVKLFFYVLGLLALGVGFFFTLPMMAYAEAYFYRSLQRRQVPLNVRVPVPLLGRSPVFWGLVAIAGSVLLTMLPQRPRQPKDKPFGDLFGIEKAQAKRREKFQAEMKASYIQEWERYKPIYDTFGMSNLWSLYQAGRCAEGKEELNKNWETYVQVVKAKGGNLSEKSLRDMADRGFDLCERMTKPDVPADLTSQTSSPRSIQDIKKDLKASNSLSSLGDMRSGLAQYYTESNGKYPSSLEGIIGKRKLSPMKLFGSASDNLTPKPTDPVIENIPTLVLPDHSETNEVIIYEASVCGGSNLNRVDGSKLKDTGKWGYVADPNASCYGQAFIDCTHSNRRSKKPWYEY